MHCGICADASAVHYRDEVSLTEQRRRLRPRLCHLESRNGNDLIQHKTRERIIDPIRVRVDLQPASVDDIDAGRDESLPSNVNFHFCAEPPSIWRASSEEMARDKLVHS